MTLLDVTNDYIDWRRAHGAKFNHGAGMLRQFCAHVGENICCDAVSRSDVLGFLAGKGPLTRYRANKYGTLSGLWRYAISRGHASCSPLPQREDEPRLPCSPPPHVFTRDELCRLFGAIRIGRRRAVQLDSGTMRTLLLLLYGAGLRRGEALRLTMGDVELEDAVLTIRQAKFFKDRLVPVGVQLVEALRAHAARRRQFPLPNGMASTFLAGRDGNPLPVGTVRYAFTNLLEVAGIRAGDDGRRAPCLHSLRHTAAVHRVEDWYRQGTDVQRLLPALSVWLGHADLDGTKTYLTMTPELLHQASVRFKNYVEGEEHA